MSPLDQLRRWEDSGGTWRVQRCGADGVTVALLRCDGGEIVDRISSSDPELRAYLDAAEQ